MERYSYSKLATYITCPLQYNYTYVEGLGSKYRRDMPYFSMGSSIHSALHSFYLQPPEKRTLDTLQKLLKKNWIRKGYSSIYEEREYVTRAQNMLERYFHENDTDFKPKFLEVFFKTELDNCVISGKVDRVDEYKPGHFEIIDYKTGSYLPTAEELEEDLQLNIYGLGIYKKTGVLPDKLSYYFLELGEKVTLDFNEHELEKTIKKITDISDNISKDNEYKPTENKFCNWCDYNILCPLKAGELSDHERNALINKTLLNLYDASKDINSILERDRLFSKIINIISEISQSVKSSLYIEEDGKLFLKAGHGINNSHIDTKTYHLNEGAVGHVYDTGKVLYLDNVSESDKYIMTNRPENEKNYSFLGLPLICNEDKIGVICLEEKRYKHSYSDYEIYSLQALSSQIAVAINNSVLYSKLEETNIKLNQNLNHLEGLHEISNQLNSISDFHKLTDFFMQTLNIVFSFDYGVFYLRESKYSKEFFLEESIQTGTENNYPNVINEDDPIINQILDNRKPFILKNKLVDSNINELLIDNEDNIIIPFLSADIVQGFLIGRIDKNNKFTSLDEIKKLLSIISFQLSTKFENLVIWRYHNISKFYSYKMLHKIAESFIFKVKDRETEGLITKVTLKYDGLSFLIIEDKNEEIIKKLCDKGSIYDRYHFLKSNILWLFNMNQTAPTIKEFLDEVLSDLKVEYTIEKTVPITTATDYNSLLKEFL